jgi:hypothetical protein
MYRRIVSLIIALNDPILNHPMFVSSRCQLTGQISEIMRYESNRAAGNIV